MRMRRLIVAAEAVRALAALALFLLGLAHAAPAYAELPFYAPGTSLCGEGLPVAPGDDRHQPCHACRIGGGADVPPPCGEIVAAFVPVTPAVYREVRGPDSHGIRHERPVPRGPPSA